MQGLTKEFLIWSRADEEKQRENGWKIFCEEAGNLRKPREIKAPPERAVKGKIGYCVSRCPSCEVAGCGNVEWRGTATGRARVFPWEVESPGAAGVFIIH